MQQSNSSQYKKSNLTVPINFISSPSINIQSLQWIKQVQQFYEQIKNDQALATLFSDQILLKLPIHQTGRNLGNNVIEAMTLLSQAMIQPPKFTGNVRSGLPFSILFVQYWQTPEGQNFFSHQKVNTSLKKLFSVYSQLLDSPQSLKHIDTWISGDALKYWNPDEFEVDRDHKTFGFKCWHDFFLRNFKQSARPIAQGEDQIASVCEHYPLLMPSMPVRNIKPNDEFWLKDNVYSLIDMVSTNKKNIPSIQQFIGGTIYQGFLSIWSYHKYHSPFNGTVLQVHKIPGHYCVQNPSIIDKNGESNNYVKSQPYLSCTSTRLVLLLESDNKNIGKVYIILVGMAQVSTCYTDLKGGEKIKKGEYIGEFRFGGSSHCLIFNKNCHLDFGISLNNSIETDKESGKQVSKRINVRSRLAKLSKE